MAKPPPKNLPWGLDVSGLAPASVDRNMPDDKLKKSLASQGIGAKKKTPFQKHLEQIEAKKKKEEDETAAVYADFLASFEDKPESGGKTFVRGETILPSAVADPAIKHTVAAERLYKPQPLYQKAATRPSSTGAKEIKEVPFRAQESGERLFINPCLF